MSDVPTPGQSVPPKRKRGKAPSPASTTQPKKTAAKSKSPRAKADRVKPSQAADPSTATARVAAEERWRLIAEVAYLRAEQRGFERGDPINDWLEAEREVDARLKRA